jgi:lysyl-tRNA synthetase class 2
MERAMKEKIAPSRIAKRIAQLIYFESLTIFGFFSLRSVPKFLRRVGEALHPYLLLSSEVASILIAVCLLMAAGGIKLRRKQAWNLALILQISLIATSLVRTIHFISNRHRDAHVLLKALGLTHLLLETLIIVLLVRHRNLFKTISDPFTRKKATLFLFRNIGLALIIGFLIVFLDNGSFIQKVSITQAFEIAIKGLVGISGPALFTSNFSQERLEFFLGGLGLIALVTSAAAFLRPISKKTLLSSENSTKIRELLRESGQADSLSYFALRDNKTVIWSKNGKVAIPYSVVSGVMISTGDPIGDFESWPSAMELFVAEADKHGWVPAIYGCTEKAGEIWVRESNFDALEIGDEAIVDVSSFSIEGPVMKNVRQTLNRIRRLEYEAKSATIADLPETKRLEMSRFMQSWRKADTERGFSMALGRFCDPMDPDCLVVWAEKSGQIMAIFQFVPWGSNSYSLDLMRRSPEADTGVSELLIIEAIEVAKQNNYSEISLNFASFRSIFERGKKLGAGPVTRANHKLLLFLSRFFQMESLYRFNAKFSPRWEPRFIVFPGLGNLVRVGYAVLRIEAFIPDLRKPRFFNKAK